MNPIPDEFVPLPDPASDRPGAFAAVRPGSAIDAALDRRLDAMAGSIIGSLRRQYHRRYPKEEEIAAWLVARVCREMTGDARDAALLPPDSTEEEALAAELRWHLHLNVDQSPLRRLHDRYADAVSAVVDFDRLTLDPEGAEAELRAAIRAGRVAGLAGFAGEARLLMREARETVRREEIDRLIETVELRPGDDPVAILLGCGLHVTRAATSAHRSGFAGT
jgi:hypothetical protein